MKKAVVLGLGLSGISACRYLLSKDFSVIACDDNPKNSSVTFTGNIKLASSQDVQAMLSRETVSVLCTSPGIPPEHPRS